MNQTRPEHPAMAPPTSDAEKHPQAQAPLETQVQPPRYTTLPAPFGLFPRFTAQKPETLVIKSTSAWTDSSYSITTLDGHPVFTIKRGESFSFTYRRRVLDANNNPVFTIKHETHFLQPTIYHALGPSETGPRLLECKFDRWSPGDKCTGHFTNATTGQQETFFLSGNIFETNATITNQRTGNVVAEIKKQSFKLKTEYHIVMWPGVDMALVVALCMVMRDRQESNHLNRNGAVAGLSLSLFYWFV